MSRDRPARSRGIVARHDGDRHRLYDETGAEIGALNETAAALWVLCDGATTRHEIAGAVARASGMDHPAAVTQVDRALDEMYAAGFLVWDDEHGARDAERSGRHD